MHAFTVNNMHGIFSSLTIGEVLHMLFFHMEWVSFHVLHLLEVFTSSLNNPYLLDRKRSLWFS